MRLNLSLVLSYFSVLLLLSPLVGLPLPAYKAIIHLGKQHNKGIHFNSMMLAHTLLKSDLT